MRMTKFFRLFAAAMLLFAGLGIVSCDKYDDSALTGRVENLEGRVEALEQLCQQMNTNISALQTIVTALQSNDYITSVAPILRGGNRGLHNLLC